MSASALLMVICDGAFGVVVVGAAVEGPVGRAAGNVGEPVAQVEPAVKVSAADAGRGARGAVGIAVVGAGEAVDLDVGVGLVDGDLDVAFGVVVVGAAVEGPVRRPPGTLVNESPRSSPLLRFSPLTPVAVPVAPWAIAVVGAGEAVDLDVGVGLVDGDGGGAALRVVVGVAGEVPVGRPARHVGEGVAEVDRLLRSSPLTPVTLPVAP